MIDETENSARERKHEPDRDRQRVCVCPSKDVAVDSQRGDVHGDDFLPFAGLIRAPQVQSVVSTLLTVSGFPPMHVSPDRGFVHQRTKRTMIVYRKQPCALEASAMTQADLRRVERAAAKLAANKEELQAAICAARASGETLRDIAAAAKMSHQRIDRIVKEE